MPLASRTRFPIPMWRGLGVFTRFLSLGVLPVRIGLRSGFLFTIFFSPFNLRLFLFYVLGLSYYRTNKYWEDMGCMEILLA